MKKVSSQLIKKLIKTNFSTPKTFLHHYIPSYFHLSFHFVRAFFIQCSFIKNKKVIALIAKKKKDKNIIRTSKDIRYILKNK